MSAGLVLNLPAVVRISMFDPVPSEILLVVSRVTVTNAHVEACKT